MEGMFLYEFQQNELGEYVDITDTLFESLQNSYTTPLFGHAPLRSTQLGTQMVLYNLIVMYGMSNMCLSTLLR